MSRAESALTLARASAVVLDACRVAAWRRQALDTLSRDPRADYATLCDTMFEATPYTPHGLCANDRVDSGESFRHAPAGSQLDLARRAVAGLAGDGREALPVNDARLLVYATSSVDENLFRSTVSSLAVDLGASSLPHFSLGQLQGASLDLAACVIDGALHDDGAAALFVAAERWPLPYPRVWDSAPLADGAAALWFVRGAGAGLRYAGGVRRGFAPFLAPSLEDDSAGGAVRPCIDRDALETAAHETITELLDQLGVHAGDLYGWIGCALDPELDERLRMRAVPEVRHVIQRGADDGDASAASTPLLLADLLEEVLSHRVPHGGLWLSWNVSLGGTVTASLWRASHEGTIP